jgi:aldose 1-epimerase
MKFEMPNSGSSRSSWFGRWSTSGWMTPSLIATVCLILALGSYEHSQGNLHRLRATSTNHVQPQGPGGQDPIRISRSLRENGAGPEFVSATLLPGRGFNLWQLTASLPGRGEVSLLVSPPVSQAAQILSGLDNDDNGSASTNYGGAFLAPWAAQLTGFPAPGSGVLQTVWEGQRLTFPASIPGSPISTEGLLLARGADAVKTSSLPDGQSAEATFNASSFSGNWPSNTDITILVELSGHSLDLTMTAHNTGNTSEPMGLGWHPYFAIPSGNRAQAMLVIPSLNLVEAGDRSTGVSSGRIIPTQGTSYDFLHASGTPLGHISLDETYVNLHGSLISDGPIAELRDPAADYGLRVIPLTPNITNLRVIAPENKPWVSIGPNTNLSNPFGSEWGHTDMSKSGTAILKPGESVQWKVRVEIFSLTGPWRPSHSH